jgi:alpha-maltose-1-phosphate synthase
MTSLRTLIIHENYMGHTTHARFIREYISRDSRFEATFISLDPDADPVYPIRFLKPAIPGLHRYGADFWGWRQFQYRKLQVRRALEQIDRVSFDIVFVHTQTVGTEIRRLFPHARIVTSIDLTWQLVGREVRYRQTPLFEPLYRLEQRVFENSDLVISWSHWAAESVIRDYGIPAERVEVVHHGVSLPNVATPQPANPDLRIGFIGNDFSRKGGDLLLRVHQEHFADRVHLTLVSSDRIPRRRLRNVTILRGVDWIELMKNVVPRFDLFVLPAMYDYSPYVVIEAKTLGVPVIAGKAGAITEMVQDGVDGFLVDGFEEQELVERIAWSLEHREQLPALGEEARRHAREHYSAERNYPKLLDLLAERLG